MLRGDVYHSPGRAGDHCLVSSCMSRRCHVYACGLTSFTYFLGLILSSVHNLLIIQLFLNDFRFHCHFSISDLYLFSLFFMSDFMSDAWKEDEIDSWTKG